MNRYHSDRFAVDVYVDEPRCRSNSSRARLAIWSIVTRSRDQITRVVVVGGGVGDLTSTSYGRKEGGPLKHSSVI